MKMIENYNPNIVNFIKYTIGNYNIAIVVFDENTSPSLYEVVEMTKSTFFSYLPKLCENDYHKEVYDYVKENKLDGAVCIYYPALDELSDDTCFFAFFHEIGHIICNNETLLGEIYADTFASDTMKKKINLKKCIKEIYNSNKTNSVSYKKFWKNLKYRYFLYKKFKDRRTYTVVCADLYKSILARIKNMKNLNKEY